MTAQPDAERMLLRFRQPTTSQRVFDWGCYHLHALVADWSPRRFLRTGAFNRFQLAILPYVGMHAFRYEGGSDG